MKHVDTRGTSKKHGAIRSFIAGIAVKVLHLQAVINIVVAEGVVLEIKAAYSFGGAQPQIAFTILQYSLDHIAGQALFMAIMDKAVCFLIQAVEPATPCTNPEVALVIYQQGGDVIVAQTVKILFIVPVVDKLPAATVMAVEPPVRTDPEATLAVFTEGKHYIIAQTSRIFWIEVVAGELSASVAVETQTSSPIAHPDVVVPILEYNCLDSPGQAIRTSRIREKVIKLPGAFVKESKTSYAVANSQGVAAVIYNGVDDVSGSPPLRWVGIVGKLSSVTVQHHQPAIFDADPDTAL